MDYEELAKEVEQAVKALSRHSTVRHQDLSVVAAILVLIARVDKEIKDEGK